MGTGVSLWVRVRAPELTVIAASCSIAALHAKAQHAQAHIGGLNPVIRRKKKMKIKPPP